MFIANLVHTLIDVATFSGEHQILHGPGKSGVRPERSVRKNFQHPDKKYN